MFFFSREQLGTTRTTRLVETAAPQCVTENHSSIHIEMSLESSPTGVEDVQQSLSNSLSSPRRIAMPHHFFPGLGI